MHNVLREALPGALVAALLGAALPASADTVHLRDGRVVTGEFLGATARTLHMRTRERIRRLELSEVERVELDPRQDEEPVAARSGPVAGQRVTIVGTGPAQAIEREPVTR